MRWLIFATLSYPQAARLAEVASVGRIFELIKLNQMNKEQLELLGSMYGGPETFDIYLDRKTGKVYKRRIIMMQDKKGWIHIGNSEFTELGSVKKLQDPFGPVLSRDN